MELHQTIAETAKYYLGQKETPNNSGFFDLQFLKEMEESGWQKSEAWCAYFAETIWRNAYEKLNKPAQVAAVAKYFSRAAVATFSNFKNAGFKTSPKPVVGALIVWKHAASSWQGHIGVVIEIDKNGTIKTIEGNTNDKGGREGYIVDDKDTLGPKYNRGDLRLIGFVHPI